MTAWGTYKDITDTLRARVTGGHFAPGASMPSESALCTEFGVARNTLRRALNQVAVEGLIAVQPGRGRVVLAVPQHSAAPTVPQYRVMAAELRASIESGELRPGEPVPSESALAQRYGVARGTARHALAELEGAGLVQAVHGKGRFVTPTSD